VTEISPIKKNIQFQKIGNNDVALSSEIIACESSSKGLNSMVASARTFDDISNNVTVPAPIITTSISDALENKDDVIKDVPTTCVVSKIDYMNPDSNIVPTREYMIGVVQYMPKPRTALFQGGENDEHMAGQINSGSNSLDVNIDSIISSSNNLKARSFIKFGAFSVDVKQMWKAEKIDSMVTLPTKIIFRGVNFHKKMEEKKQRKYFYIGAMEVDVDEVMPT